MAEDYFMTDLLSQAGLLNKMMKRPAAAFP